MTGGNAIADRDLEILHGAGRRRGNLHGCLVRLEHDERLFGADLIAHGDEHFDDLYVRKISKLGNDDLHVIHGLGHTLE